MQNTQSVSCCLSKEVNDRVALLCKRTNCSKSLVIRFAIEKFIERLSPEDILEIRKLVNKDPERRKLREAKEKQEQEEEKFAGCDEDCFNCHYSDCLKPSQEM